ncbi:MAG: nucleotide exchange factor GrpE [Firmicutes bacterium HGW-Firmicutes-11]|jgi:molecular chaperone GrpE|nr:MAG: nucleotide exchange factor GrpE [Firmicutes bacterium HGW-Firmicutes-11]
MSTDNKRHKHKEHTEDIDRGRPEGEPDQEQAAEQPEATEQVEPTKPMDSEDTNTKLLRLAADFQNFRRRVEKEKGDIYAYANERLIAELLSVVDNFDRALSVESTDKNLQNGMELILKQFTDVLSQNGLEEISAVGSEFDPNFHHAVIMEKVDTGSSGHVVQVLQKGYLLNKKVIRPAMVKVAE